MHLKKLLEQSMLLTEMPIGDINMLGNWDKNSSFRARDRKALTNPKLIQKTRANFNHTSYDFQMFFINHPEGSKYPNSAYGRIGDVEKGIAFIESNLPRLAPEFRQMQEYGQGFKENSINIIYGNNTSGDNVPMTPWMIAHRIAHAMERDNYTNFANHQYEYIHEMMIRCANDVLKHGYGVPEKYLMRAVGRDRQNFEKANHLNQTYRGFFRAIGKTRAMRSNKLSFYSEALPEMLAQYICTGAVSFNPAPPSIKIVFGHRKYRDDRYSIYGSSDQAPEGTRHFHLRDPEAAADQIAQMAEILTDSYDGLLGQSVGDVYMV